VDEIYSHSRLSSFESCPRKFQYRYIYKIPATLESIEAFVGKRVHEVLERLYEAVDRGHVPTLPQVIARYEALFDEHYDAERITIVRTENPVGFYRNIGVQSLSNYYQSHYPFDADETMGLEEHVQFELGQLDSGRVRIRGYIDRIAQARDGTIEIHDYKTSARVPKQSDLDTDRQLALYQVGLGERFGEDQPMRLVWHFVRRNQTRTSSRTAEQLAELKENTLGLVDKIRRATVFDPRVTALCGWCEFKTRCPASPTRDASLLTYEEERERDEAERAAMPRTAAAGAESDSDQLALPLNAPTSAGGG
jgi:putative RecB family exonuclease